MHKQGAGVRKHGSHCCSDPRNHHEADSLAEDRLYSLGDGVLGSLDFAEELLRYAVVEGELAIEHGEEHHAQRPHVTGFSTVRPACREGGDKSIKIGRDKSNRNYSPASPCSPPPEVKALKQPLRVFLFSKHWSKCSSLPMGGHREPLVKEVVKPLSQISKPAVPTELSSCLYRGCFPC